MLIDLFCFVWLQLRIEEKIYAKTVVDVSRGVILGVSLPERLISCLGEGFVWGTEGQEKAMMHSRKFSD